VKIGRAANASSTAVGNGALAAALAASVGSTAVGSSALASLTSALNNTAVGRSALGQNITGAENTALGSFAALSVIAARNTAVGYSSMQFSNNALAVDNVAIGHNALNANTYGAGNTCVGSAAGSPLTGDGNVFIGWRAGGVAAGTANNVACIGSQATPSSVGVSNEFTLGNSSVTVLRCAVTVITAISDARDKTNIQPLVPGLDFVNRLKPVSFDWNMRDGGKVGIADTGFLAQDLKSCQTSTEFIPGLVYESNPDRLEAAYGKLLPVLVKAIQELTARIAVLEAR
jgi:hypothetical protein